MNLTEFKTKIVDLNVEIREGYGDQENDVYPIYDGAFNPEEYFNYEGLKLMWLMKEAYEEGAREGDWSYPDLYLKDYERFYRDLIRGKSNSTWQPIVYASYGILNDFIEFTDISNIEDDPNIVKVLDKVSLANIQKLPSETGSRTNNVNIYEAYQKHKTLLLRQIELLNPDVVICANVFSVIKGDLQIISEGKYKTVEYYITDKRLYINAYHPAQTTILRNEYVNDIVSCVREFRIN